MALRGTAGIANGATGTTVTVNVAGIGIQSGDLVLLFGISGGSGTLTPTLPSGFAPITGLANINNNGSTVYAAFKVATASEPSTYTVTPGSTDFHALQCRVYSGRSGSFTAKASTGSTAATYPITFAMTGVTAAANDDVAVLIGIAPQGFTDSYTYTPPASFGNGLLTQASAPFQTIAASSDEIAVAAGATGTVAGGMTDSVTANDHYAGYVLSMAAGAAGPAALVAAPAVSCAVSASLTTFPQMGASAIGAASVTAALTNFLSVVLTSPAYTGVGSIYDPNFWLDAVPAVGNTVWFDPAITVAPTGEVSSSTCPAQAVVQFNSG